MSCGLLTKTLNSSFLLYCMSAMGMFKDKVIPKGTIGRIGAGVLSDMTCVHRLTLNSVCFVMAGVSMFVASIYPSFEILLLCSSTFGVFFGAIYVVQPAVLLEYIGEEFVSEFIGLMMCTYGVSCLIGSPLAGWLFDVTGSYRTTFLVGGILNTLGGIVNFLVLCTKRSRRHEANG